MPNSSKNKSIFVSYHTVTILISLYFTLVINISIYKELLTIISKISSVNIGFLISVPFFLLFAFIFIFSIFSWPKFTKPFFILLIIASSLVCYATFNYRTIFNTEMIENFVETNVSEASAYLSIKSAIWVIAMGGIPSVLLFMLPLKQENLVRFIAKKIGLMVISVIGLGIIAGLYYQDYVSVGRNNSELKKIIIPTYYVNSIVLYLKTTYFTKPMPYVQIGLDARQQPVPGGKKPLLVVFMLGETARAANYHSYGYAKPTTPYTNKLGVISFKHVYSCGTSTAVSVPCMFSRLDRTDYDEQVAHHQDNLLDVLKRAGIDIFWKENDGASKGIPKHVRYQNLERSAAHPLCHRYGCLDMALLENFDKDVNALNGNRFVVLHMMGSHGPTYFQRYTPDFAYFQPDCAKADIENCTHEQLVNTYDNTIRYTDYVVAETIERLQSLSNTYDTALIYMSDHGESLGENGIYLHGLPYSFAPEEQKHVPMMLWLSKGFKQAYGINMACVNQQAQTGHFSHDNFFDLILGIFNISTRIYRSDMDMLELCRPPR